MALLAIVVVGVATVTAGWLLLRAVDGLLEVEPVTVPPPSRALHPAGSARPSPPVPPPASDAATPTAALRVLFVDHLPGELDIDCIVTEPGGSAWSNRSVGCPVTVRVQLPEAPRWAVDGFEDLVDRWAQQEAIVRARVRAGRVGEVLELLAESCTVRLNLMAAA